jgi:hypothetical protein
MIIIKQNSAQHVTITLGLPQNALVLCSSRNLLQQCGIKQAEEHPLSSSHIVCFVERNATQQDLKPNKVAQEIVSNYMKTQGQASQWYGMSSEALVVLGNVLICARKDRRNKGAAESAMRDLENYVRMSSGVIASSQIEIVDLKRPKLSRCFRCRMKESQKSTRLLRNNREHC